MKYLFIESRDPFESTDTQFFSDLVKGVKKLGRETTLFLVQNSVLSTRKGAKYNDQIAQLAQSGVTVLADGFSLKERGIDHLVEGIEVSNMDQLVQLLLEPETKAIWH